eukprot:m.68100 g.68100  ORF g.68100 m.68100 type:complete len:148 (+) comp35489_c0_seq1:469-912(+)
MNLKQKDDQTMAAMKTNEGVIMEIVDTHSSKTAEMEQINDLANMLLSNSSSLTSATLQEALDIASDYMEKQQDFKKVYKKLQLLAKQKAVPSAWCRFKQFFGKCTAKLHGWLKAKLHGWIKKRSTKSPNQCKAKYQLSPRPVDQYLV